MAEEVFTCCPEEDLIDRTWRKMERDLRKEGFREGALKGQEEFYQSGFDLGYSEGFRIGETLGFYKGTSSLLKNLKVEKSDLMQKEEIFVNSEREKGCVLCQDKDSLIKNLNDVVTNQRNVNDAIISYFNCGIYRKNSEP